jgi:ElaB/YqjD/DUF883 family membrane-anchored ribosome-binding protein
MRNRESIEREITNAREDLEASLSELRHVVQEKVDIKARGRIAIEKGKMQAQDLLERGKVQAQELLAKGKVQARELASKGRERGKVLYDSGRETVRERPVLVGSIAAGVIAAGVLIYVARKNDWI